MNFTKSLKFSVKGIDTTRYISSEAKDLLLYAFGEVLRELVITSQLNWRSLVAYDPRD